VDEGLAAYIGRFLDAGFSENAVQQMVASNPASVLK